MSQEPAAKPTWRGWLHLVGAVVVLACSPLLFVYARNAAGVGWTLAFVIGVTVMMGTSALFHRVTWSPRARRAWKRADHSAIFAAISGSYVAIAGLTMHGVARILLLSIVGVGTIVGVTIRQLALDTPKWVNTLPYLVVGWAAVAFLPQIVHGGGLAVLLFVLGGGLAYTIGAVCYGLKRPTLWPKTFGYHELFHAFTLVGVSLHFVAIDLALR